MGSVYQRGSVWWIQYFDVNGQRQRESAGSERKTDAQNLLRLREGDTAKGVPVTPAVQRLTFADAAADLLMEYRVNGRKSLSHVDMRLRRHLLPYFGQRRLSTITTDDLRRYIAHRQAQLSPDGELQPASNASINRELAIVKRMFSLAIGAGKLLYRPHIPMLREDNVRKGFFERDQYEAVLKRLPTDVQPVVTFAYITGWRIPSEVLPLEWRQVDFHAGTITLDVGTTKNGKGRTFPPTGALRVLLEQQQRRANELKQQGRIVAKVFVRDDGTPIKCFRRVFDRACREAGCPGRIPHDFRRTAVRNLVRARIPERVAMQMTGHLTRSVFERYNIVSEGDLKAAGERLSVALG